MGGWGRFRALLKINWHYSDMINFGYLREFQGTHFFQGRLNTYPFKELSQKESISFLNDNSLIITDERNDMFGGGYVYELSLPNSNQSGYNVSITPKKVITDSLVIQFGSPDYR
ncbi:MAG: hypothetical protein U5L96_08440 [Owenweeksia sp.]|nr:hypothetical protein [Owenweeksia sp.]